MPAQIARLNSVGLLLVEIRKRKSIRAAIFTRVEAANHSVITFIARDILHKVWDELDYRVDICHVSHGERIECP